MTGKGSQTKGRGGGASRHRRHIMTSSINGLPPVLVISVHVINLFYEKTSRVADNGTFPVFVFVFCFKL